MMFNEIDQMLFSLAIQAEKLEHRVSRRLGRVVRNGIIRAHEKLGLIRKNCISNRKNLAAVMSGPSPCLPRYPALFLSHAEWTKKAVEISKGTIHLDQKGSLNVETLSWLQDPLAGTYSVSRLLFHALEWVEALLYSFQETNNPEYLTLAKKLVLMWMKECLDREGTGNIWSDHGTALRAVVLCRLWVLSQATEPEDSAFMTQLIAGILRHGEKLSHPKFYRKDHNHGVAQAYALFVLGLCLSQHPKGSEWTGLGQSRIESQMEDNVSCEGLHREHSPYYHFFVYRHFHYAYELGKAQGITFSQAFATRLQDMLHSGVHLIKPNGAMWALGDTAVNSPVLIERNERSEWPINIAHDYLYSSSEGREGKIPERRSVLFPHAGLCFLRSGWGNGTRSVTQELCMAIRTGTFPTSHIHRDVGSFELYGYGDDLIVDSGGPYAYGHPLRGNYFLSTRAHNTVVVDGKDQGVGESQVVRWETTEQYDYLQIEHGNYSGTIHQRSIIFLRPDYFIILDQIQSDKSHSYSQIFHLHERLQIDLKEMMLATEDLSKGPTVRIIPFCLDGLGIRIHRGALDPWQGMALSG